MKFLRDVECPDKTCYRAIYRFHFLLCSERNLSCRDKKKLNGNISLGSSNQATLR